jgi:putative ABC transport system permease protein
MLFIQYEISHDRYHENADKIYRILIRQPNDIYQGIDMYSISPPPLKAALLNDFPEIQNAARILKTERLINYKNNRYLESRFFTVDPEFLKIFTFPLKAGDRETALNEPFSILITEEMAEKYFRDEDPMSKILTIDNEYDYKIVGILRNVPGNSHFQFDFLGSFNSLYPIYGDYGKRFFEDWNAYQVKTYLQLHSSSDTGEFNSKFPVRLEKYRGRPTNDEIYVQPLTDIHLGGNVNDEIEANSDIRYVYFFSAIALLIMLVACFNYMNLSTAGAVQRMKEVGIRKVVGAGRNNLIRQFLGESLLFAFMALLFSVLLVKLLLPVFSSLLEKELSFQVFNNIKTYSSLIGISVFVGILAGSYPAFFLSSFLPVNIIKGKWISRKSLNRSSGFRNTLVVAQFAISTVLVICTIFIHNQLEYIRKKELGFKKEYIVTVPIQDENLKKDYEPLTYELSQYSKILDVTISNFLPFTVENSQAVDWDGRPDDGPDFRYLCVEHNFLDFYGIELAEGRNFSEDIATDVEQAYILNESAVSLIGWDDPIGKRFNCQRNVDGQVIGVVNNFHCHSLHRQIEPLVIFLLDDSGWWDVRYFSIKISSSDISGTLALIEKKFKDFSPYPLNYSFLDERIDMLYRKEQKLGQSFEYFTFVAIFIACLGLFGLASLTSGQRTKEIGIRKTLGASVNSISLLLTKEFMKLTSIGIMIAFPVSYFAMHKWLKNFAYRIDITWIPFVGAVVITILLSLGTISYQVIKAATANPVDSLRYE